jgi:hypothetical protein
VGGDKAREQDSALVSCRASPAIVQMKTKRMSSSEQRAPQGQHMVQVVRRPRSSLWSNCLWRRSEQSDWSLLQALRRFVG